ncbi:hypothetical protein LguiB_036411 [Lonicera macranthoides]
MADDTYGSYSQIPPQYDIVRFGRVRPATPQGRSIYSPHGFVSGSSRPASQGVTHPGIALAADSLNFGVLMGSEASEPSKGLVKTGREVGPSLNSVYLRFLQKISMVFSVLRITKTYLNDTRQIISQTKTISEESSSVVRPSFSKLPLAISSHCKQQHGDGPNNKALQLHGERPRNADINCHEALLPRG